MAPKRRSTGARAASAAQQQATLSFHGKQNKVTKPSTVRDGKSSKKDPAIVEDVVRADVKAEAQPELREPTTSEKAIQQQAEEETANLKTAADPLDRTGASVKVEDVLGGRAKQSDAGAVGGKGSGWVDGEEEKARKISEAQIKKYWRSKEEERLVPRVHQEDLSMNEKILREWDMSGQFGPCIGIARLKRWKRANMLGLKPPVEVLAVLLKEMDGGEIKSQRAHVDELLNSRYIET